VGLLSARRSRPSGPNQLGLVAKNVKVRLAVLL
jgi:hypothetical protein